MEDLLKRLRANEFRIAHGINELCDKPRVDGGEQALAAAHPALSDITVFAMSDDLVKAALKWADEHGYMTGHNLEEATSDPNTIAAIIKTAGGKKDE